MLTCKCLDETSAPGPCNCECQNGADGKHSVEHPFTIIGVGGLGHHGNKEASAKPELEQAT
jgi:hypothetical protein